ncbi:hypothetical protein B7494_g5979 [Chlorociboria aeruginascens]|nr:hypothetical protein B7494_g5979 [Chlorociboria aeruginascens]
MDAPPTKRPPKSKQPNPIASALLPFLETLPASLFTQIGTTIASLLSSSPKRWVVYEPMLLLPSGSFTSQPWPHLLSSLSNSQSSDLWAEILKQVGKREGKGRLTHLAINSGIPLHSSLESGNGEDEAENILRSPCGLIILCGDFGPAFSPAYRPSERDFTDAFWVSTKQNGVAQVWAPRYSMFSRGNVKEKARLLEFKKNDDDLGGTGKEIALDLYSGIGYFMFSYVGMGMQRVFGWELNPWSVEGLRRGALANGWSVKIVKEGEEWEDGGERIVVFEEDNRFAGQRMEKIGKEGVRHVNCGLLPSSEGSWEMALALLGKGWLHLHENVGVNDVENRSGEIEGIFKEWLKKRNNEREVKVDHVEYVKTFAPGVWHCVFDIHISTLNES